MMRALIGSDQFIDALEALVSRRLGDGVHGNQVKNEFSGVGLTWANIAKRFEIFQYSISWTLVDGFSPRAEDEEVIDHRPYGGGRLVNRHHHRHVVRPCQLTQQIHDILGLK